MANNSNQTGALLLISLVMGAAVAALMFFGSEMEQTNVSASFGNLANESTSKSIFKAKKSIASDLSVAETRSDLSGVTLPAHKMKST
jgi:hypothetical protein